MVRSDYKIEKMRLEAGSDIRSRCFKSCNWI